MIDIYNIATKLYYKKYQYIMKGFLTIIAFMFMFNMNAQRVLSFESPEIQIENKKYTLLDIDEVSGSATIKYEEFKDGELSITGQFIDNKINGVWKEYDNGNLKSTVVYGDRGDKVLHTIFGDYETKTIHYLNNKPIKIITEVSMAYVD